MYVCMHVSKYDMYIRMHVSMYGNMYVCMYISMQYMYVCMYICIEVYMHVRMHICINERTYMYTFMSNLVGIRFPPSRMSVSPPSAPMW